MKTRSLAAVLALAFATPAGAQELCIDNVTCSQLAYFQVDDCNLSAAKNLTFTSLKTAENYRRPDNNQLGNYALRIKCRLYDVTTSSYVQLGNVEFENVYYAVGGQPGDLYTNLEGKALASNGKFEFSATGDHKLRFHFPNVTLTKGHSYGVSMLIYNYSDMFWGQSGTTLQADESSQQILVDGWANDPWGTWKNMIIQPSFTSVGNGKIVSNKNSGEVFFVGTDSRVYSTVWDGTQWVTYGLNPNASGIRAGSLAVNHNSGEVFYTDNQGYLGHAVWANNTWNFWRLNSSSNNTAPGQIAVNSTTNQVFYVGNDNRVYNAVYTNNQWNLWGTDWSFTDADPRAIAVNDVSSQFFVIGTDHRVYNGVYTNNQWNIWGTTSSFALAAYGAIAVNKTNSHVFVIGTDNRIYEIAYVNNSWVTTCIDLSFNKAAPGALEINDGNGELSFIGTDGNVYNALYTNNQWTIFPLVSNYAAATTNSIGINKKRIGTRNYTYIYSRNTSGQLVATSWFNCTATARLANPGAGTEEPAAAPVRELSLSLAPNPLVDRAHILFDLPEEAKVSLAVYNISGAKVLDIAPEAMMGAGRHNVALDRGNLAAGIYYLTLQAGTERKVTKLVIR